MAEIICPTRGAESDCMYCPIIKDCKAEIRERLGQKTLHDCARCDVLKICDAHGGTGWNHAQGVKPCKVDIWKGIMVAS